MKTKKKKKRAVNKLTKKYQYKLAKREKRKQDYEWSMAVRAADNNQCPICLSLGLVSESKGLHTHHLIPREHAPTRHLVKNGITLCAKHHKYSFEISAHRNAFAFYHWFITNRREQYEYLLDFMKNLKQTTEVANTL